MLILSIFYFKVLGGLGLIYSLFIFIFYFYFYCYFYFLFLFLLLFLFFIFIFIVIFIFYELVILNLRDWVILSNHLNYDTKDNMVYGYYFRNYCL